MSEIERVAMAIFSVRENETCSWLDLKPRIREEFMEMARRAIAAHYNLDYGDAA